MTKQQLDAISKVLPVQMMTVCGVEMPCIPLDAINQLLGVKGKLLEIKPYALIEGMLQDLNYIADGDGKTWVTAEATLALVKRQKSLLNKALIMEYLQSLITSEEAAEA